MLVLTRKAGESIHIGDDIEIVVTAIEQNKVRIGIRSPRHIPVYREELYRKIREENREAVRMNLGDMDRLLELYAQTGSLGSGREPTQVDRKTLMGNGQKTDHQGKEK